MVTGLGEIAEKLRRSTVVIQSGGRGSGSGVIWSSDGSIITNAHVARGTQVKVQLWDGREFDATIASRDSRRDLALLRIGAIEPPVGFGRRLIAGSPRRTRHRYRQSVRFRRCPHDWCDSYSWPAPRARLTIMGAGRCSLGTWQFRRPTCRRTWLPDRHQHHDRGSSRARYSE